MAGILPADQKGAFAGKFVHQNRGPAALSRGPSTGSKPKKKKKKPVPKEQIDPVSFRSQASGAKVTTGPQMGTRLKKKKKKREMTFDPDKPIMQQFREAEDPAEKKVRDVLKKLSKSLSNAFTAIRDIQGNTGVLIRNIESLRPTPSKNALKDLAKDFDDAVEEAQRDLADARNLLAKMDRAAK